MKKERAASHGPGRLRKELKRRARVMRRLRIVREHREGLCRRARSARRELVAARKALRRREFLIGAAGSGVILAAPELLGGCHHDEEVKPGTTFFNLSHLDSSKAYFLTGGGHSYRLTKVSENPDVLARARRSNSFLRRVPDWQITHHIEGTSLAEDKVSLVYLSSDIDKAAGTWEMAAVYIQFGLQSVGRAYQGARARTPSGPLPLSPKRKRYGIPPAETEQDLREEQVLFDVTTQAAAILGGGPDLFSLDPGSGNHIHTNHINKHNSDVENLAELLGVRMFGPATPEQSPGKTNDTGWGTLTPVVNDAGSPLKNTQGFHAGRIQYIPVFHPDIAQVVGQAAARIAQSVKDDPSVGFDVTGLNPQPSDPPNPALAGAMWLRRDGSSSVRLGAGQGGAPSTAMTLEQIGPQNGLEVGLTVTQGQPPQVSLLLENWYVRFLGVYLQFLAEDGTVLALANIPEYVNGSIISGHDTKGDTTNEMFISVLGPIFTILGIPTWPGYITPTFNVPESAHTVRILASGIGTGANNYPDTLLPGAFMTGVVSYGLTALLCAVGAAASVGLIMKTVVSIARPLALEIVTLLSQAISGNSAYSTAFWKAQGLALLKWVLTRDVSGSVSQLVEELFEVTTEAVVEDSIPVAGWILLGISVAVGVATLLETTIETVESPWTYVNDVVFTHDLAVDILKDPGDGSFPAEADHYVVTALFEDGTPYVQTLSLPQQVPATLPPVVFSSVPLGGQVNVSVAFYQQGTGTSGILLGKGTTGLVDNDVNANPTITIQEVRYPINSSTVYEHRQKTALDSGGNHFWDVGAPAPTATAASCGDIGSLCSFRDITVRQETGAQQGYVGYAWEGDSSNGTECGSPGTTGQFDQLANLNTGSNAQAGYLAGPCGFQNPTVRVTYSLLSHDSENFYLDTSNPNALHLRQVTLAPPGYEPPSSSNPLPPSQSWGVLNFMPDALLLHPAGYIVSISTVTNKMETLPIPPAPMPDADALVHLVAQTKSGQGSRPGLMTSPVAAAVAPDGTILVLEFGDQDANPPVPARIQAFDLGGNPKPFFPNQTSPYTLQLTATPNSDGWQYLDLAVEYGGLIYVLSQLQGTSRLDIYQPGQSGTAPLCTTTGINAAKIAVDFWRNLYALNYEVIPGAPQGYAEPSISKWTPNSSCVGAGCSS